MKILFSAKYLYPIKGGGERSVFTLLKALSINHQIYVICEGKENKVFLVRKNIFIIHRRVILSNLNRFIWIRRYLQNLHWKFILDRYLPIINPKIILTQLDFSLATIPLAKKYRIPSILFIRFFLNFCPFGFRTIKNESCNENCINCNVISLFIKNIRKREVLFEFLFISKLIKWNNKAIQDSDLIISNSQYSAHQLLKFFNRKSEVIYPFIKFQDYKTETSEKRYITMINPTKSKGVEIFIKLAYVRPDLNFFTVGKTDKMILNRLNRLKNMDYKEWIDEVKGLYAKTYILLIPSEEETFGRVAVEAMVNGIPVIGSNVGGIPEVIPDDLIVKNSRSLKEWIQKLNIVIDKYQYYSELVMKKTSNFNSSKMIERFQMNVKQKFNLEI